MNYYEVLVRGAGGPKSRFTYASEVKLAQGQLVKVPLKSSAKLGAVVAKSVRPAYAAKRVEATWPLILPKPNLELIAWVADNYSASESMATRIALPATIPRSLDIPALSIKSKRKTHTLKLSSKQEQTLNSILKSNSSAGILHGETASGKTLIYRELIKQTLAGGKSALLLVPEIGLTPQLVADMSDLSEQVLVSHSSLTPAQRSRIWLYALQQNQPKLVIGTRSALFVPLNNLGLIIIDESHESSYKQDSSPRYQTQAVAMQLAKLSGAKLVLGSATPRINDYQWATRHHFPIWRLARFDTRYTPQVDTIDMRQAESKINPWLSRDLMNAITDNLKKHKQTLLYLNRRGTAALGLCANCGWVSLCPKCELPLRLHHDQNRLICHQCGHSSKPAAKCPECAGAEIIYKGVGTKALEAEVGKLFPNARIARFDSDNPADLRLERRYDQVLNKEFDIIIGTQTVAKGLDFPDLSLVGVISADSELYLPDYSAAERAFQLLYQVIGRAGRTGPGRIIIQTHNPANPAIKFAIARDYQGFYEHERSLRRRHKYPPFGHMLAGITSAGKSATALKRAKEALKEYAKIPGLQVLGPAPAFIHRQGGSWRFQLIFKHPQRRVLVRIADDLRRSGKWQTDIDPPSLLY